MDFEKLMRLPEKRHEPFELDSDGLKTVQRRLENPRTGIAPYSGSWDEGAVAHLLNRTLFGFTKETAKKFIKRGASASIDKLLNYSSTVTPPVNDYYHKFDDPDIEPNKTWINAKRAEDSKLTNYRILSLKSWWIKNILKQAETIEEKMLFFWHSILVTSTSDVFSPIYSYRYVELLRRNSLGDYKNMLSELTTNGAMLYYLNGHRNHKNAPDENYARELQELFAVGKGPDSKYTEIDVREAAKVLTGWRAQYYEYTVSAKTYRHDTTDKQFSEFYDNKVIKGSDAQTELKELIDMIVEHPTCAKYIARRIYRFFVYAEIDEWTEENIIAPLAQTFVENNYEIKPVMRQLLLSEHFYDELNRSAIIKSPLDFFCSMLKSTGTEVEKLDIKENISLYYYASLYYHVGDLGLIIGDPLSVSGWPPHYQTPGFDYLWITSTSIEKRSKEIYAYANWGLWIGNFDDDELGNLSIFSNFIPFISSFKSPSDPVKLVEELMTYSISYTANRNDVLDFLKTSLVEEGDQDYYWTQSWNNYKQNPQNEEYRNIVFYRLNSLISKFLHLPEFQLS